MGYFLPPLTTVPICNLVFVWESNSSSVPHWPARDWHNPRPLTTSECNILPFASMQNNVKSKPAICLLAFEAGNQQEK
ncbi:hypothetical protein ACFX2C_017679 [Malus domestica]